MNKLTQILWKLFLFSFPFSLHIIFFEKNSYRFGHFNPWVTGFLYLPEVLLLIVALLHLINSIKEKIIKWPKMSSVMSAFLGFFFLNLFALAIFKQSLPELAFFLWRIAQVGLLYWLLKAQLIKPAHSMRYLLYGAGFQVILGLLQTILNQSVGLSVLGEPNISADTLNVAKRDVSNDEKAIRAYGTFLHPNIMGAYLLTLFFTSIAYLKKRSGFIWLALILFGIGLTHSLAAILGVVLLLAYWLVSHQLKRPKNKKKFLALTLGLLAISNTWLFINSARFSADQAAVSERLHQNVISLDMFLNHFWGVGIGQFTLNMENFSQLKLNPWEFQPVHNAYFLFLNESGIQGFFLFIMLLSLYFWTRWRSSKRGLSNFELTQLPLLGLLLIASFDHLLLTSYIGPYLIALALAQSSAKV